MYDIIGGDRWESENARNGYYIIINMYIWLSQLIPFVLIFFCAVEFWMICNWVILIFVTEELRSYVSKENLELFKSVNLILL